MPGTGAYSRFRGFYPWLVAWRTGNAFHSINEVTVRWAGLELGWVTAISACNQPLKSTQLSMG